MRIISKKELPNRENNTIRYKLDDNILRSNIADVIRLFETQTTEFLECECDTYDEDGCVMHVYFNNLDEIKRLKDYPSPYMNFRIDYEDTCTGKKVCTIHLATNDNTVDYICYSTM